MSLFDDFEGATHQEWHDRIIKDLKGKDFNENLVWKSEEGIEVQPFYTVENLKNNKSKAFNLKNESTAWENRFVIKINTITEANKKALYVLSRGVNSIQFVGNISSQEEFNLLLKDIDVSIIHVHFYNSKPNQTATFFSTYLLKNKIDLVNSNYSISFDYINNFLTNGNWIIDEQKDLEELFLLQKNSIPFKTITVNGLALNNAGATIIQELAYSFSQAVEYINFLTDKGLKINDIVPKITFNFGIGSNYFFEIAKIRAAKILWKIILDEYQANETSIYINSTTTITNFSCFDQHNNILRTTTEAMSAIVGGANSVSILPFDTAFENTTNFSERIAINIQHILKEETFLDKVADISNGAYYIESLTDEMVEKALSLFKEIEQNGGFLVNIKNETIQDAIHQAAQHQQELFTEGKKTLLGVNKHQNKTLPNLSLNETKTTNKITQSKVLQQIRYSEKIEKKIVSEKE
jgi:methylmalonyl-CoA mutase